ncbi:MAG TPA: sigma-70 family RNA polymerase sigma factor [Solirubrobacteraceae bacterium]|nr:sigma-70 family RNA polymerase sigma factor [Solirubrobacteraceae bacterium]
MTRPDATHLAARFDDERGRLRRLAARMLGSPADAEDAVQEAWLRLSRTDGADIVDLHAWLTTVTSRVCLDMLRARRSRGEVPIEIDLDELLAGASSRSTLTPEDEALLANGVGVALHVVMDTLTPAERVAFVLHDIFDLPFAQVAEVLGRSVPAVKMLASRGRGRVRLVPERAADGRPEDRAVVDAFFAAAGSGDLSGLLPVLAPDAELHVVGPRITRTIRGAETIASQARAGARGGFAGRAAVRPVTVRGNPGALVLVDGEPLSLIAFTVREGRITEMRSFSDRPRLGRLIPSWVA